MALSASVQANGTVTPSPAEEDALYTELLRVQDAVVNGTHPRLKLPPAGIESLKAALLAAPPAASVQSTASSLANGIAYSANAATNHTQLPSTPTLFPSLPGLQAPPSSVNASAAGTTPGGLNPIFLEKSDSLVRAEGQLKRQRIERDLQAQVEQRKHQTQRERDPGAADAPSPIDVSAILATSSQREAHKTAIRSVGKAGSAASNSSFDTNDYYSSQVESDWSSPRSASKGSDRATGAFAADFDPIEAPSAPFAKAAGKQPAIEPFGEEDEDDEYTPPDAAAFASFDTGIEEGQITPEDDDEDYEPGEIMQESAIPAPYTQLQVPSQPSPKVPVIRNHLTHIAAPQPNRVSPLAVAKGPNIELELVNGRPEVVKKAQQQQRGGPSRASTASPAAANGTGPSSNKKKMRANKKRKREEQQQGTGRAKKKRDKQPARQSSPTFKEPRIKDEPISPPPFANIPEAQPYVQRYRPAEIDLVSPRHVQPQIQYAYEPARSDVRYEYAMPQSPAVVRIASPAGHRPAQRDTQDLRRVASLHYAQRPPSPSQRGRSPAPQRTVSASYGDPRITQPPAEPQARYYEQAPSDHVTYVRERSPPRLQEYREPYNARPQSPALMPPPASAPRRIVVDQYGNRYYAADPDPAPAPAPPISRASVAPVDRRPHPEMGYERAPSRMATSYGQPVPAAYEQPEARMAPPPPRSKLSNEQTVQYVDANGYPVRGYEARPAQQARYAAEPTSPVYQSSAPRYDMAPPPAPAVSEPTSPVYAPPTRAYSVRPEDPASAAASYTRQASVAPVQYVYQDTAAPPPARAMSVMPGYEQPRQQSYAPQAVRYVDQYGREVQYQSDVRYQ